MIKLKDILLESVQAINPPTQIQPHIQSVFDRSFIDYIKFVENGNRVGYDKNKKLWFPYAKAENGNVVIAYGHKSKSPIEIKSLKKGITDDQAERLLISDLEIAKQLVNKYIEKKYKVKLLLDKNQNEILADFAFNLGGLEKFPKFVDAVLKKDWKVVKKEYKRNTDGNMLTKRNQEFFNRYLTQL